MTSISDFICINNEKIIVDDIEHCIMLEEELFLKDDFYYPKSIFISDEKIYVTDSYHNEVKIYDKEKNLIDAFGNDILREPYKVIYYNDKIYVANKDCGKISVFDKSYMHIKDIGKGLFYPSFFDIYMDKIYVANTNGHDIHIYDIEGELIKKIKNAYKYPLGIKHYKKYIVFADQFNKKIRIIDYEEEKEAVLLDGEYYSCIEIVNGKLLACIEQRGEIVEKKIDEKQLDFVKIENNNKEKSKYIGYENLKYEQTLKQLSKDIQLEKVKAMTLENENIWSSIHNHRKIIKYNMRSNLIEKVYQADIQAEKLIVTETRLIILDYFFRDIFIADKETFQRVATLKAENFKRPVDIVLNKNRLYVLDSLINKVFIFNKFGKYIKEHKIKGEDNVSIKVFENKVYILDKRAKKIRNYDIYFNIQEEIDLKESLCPEEFWIDEEELYVCDDKKNTLMKYNAKHEFCFEIDGYFMPNTVIKDQNRLYVSDFSMGDIVIYNIEEK